MEILSTTASAFHGGIKRQNKEEIERIDEVIAFLKAYPDLNLFSVDEKKLKELADVIRSALGVYSKEILELAEKHKIAEFKKEMEEIEKIVATDILKNAKSDIFSKYDKAPNKKEENHEKHEFFISYSSKDKKLARQIRDIIFEHNFDVFLAHRDIPMSKVWRDEIISHLETCTTLVALCTEKYKCSTWGNQEVGIALEKNKKIIPIFYKGTTKSDYGFLETKQGPPDEISEENVSEIIENMLASPIIISKKPPITEVIPKSRIVEDLKYLRNLINSDLHSQRFQQQDYPTDVFSSFSKELMQIDIEMFRKVQETYNMIKRLNHPTIMNREINRQNYLKALETIDETISLLV